MFDSMHLKKKVAFELSRGKLVITFACTNDTILKYAYRCTVGGHPDVNGRQYRLIANPMLLKDRSAIQATVTSYTRYDRARLLQYIRQLADRNSTIQ